ncbi:hypothetical protein [Domibacillus aminovorans]|uniref:hypothetical protein n=1 Tax=Domibacillus aminovorans TaxID=29332 RepID=UPI0012FDFCC9|nr:hypothetical protein [Domibacillus aminovorans]
MYFVMVPSIISGNFTIERFKDKEDAKDRVKEIVKRGRKEVFLAEEIPMKIKVEVEF